MQLNSAEIPLDYVDNFGTEITKTKPHLYYIPYLLS